MVRTSNIITKQYFTGKFKSLLTVITILMSDFTGEKFHLGTYYDVHHSQNVRRGLSMYTF